MRKAIAMVILSTLTMVTGCGYHRAGVAGRLPPDVRTLAVPIFVSKVQGFRVESIFTQAVVRELNARTRYRVVTSKDTGDAVLHGTILTETISPLTYDASSGQTSSYLIAVTASVSITGDGGKVYYKNDAFAWREQFQSTQDLSGSVQEDSAAVQRMAHDFAEALVNDVMESFQ